MNKKKTKQVESHVIKHHDNKYGRLQSSLARFTNSLLANVSEEDAVQYKFLITKTDGSQRYVKAHYIEFDVVNHTAEVFKSMSTVNGTQWSDVAEVEEVTNGLQ